MKNSGLPRLKGRVGLKEYRACPVDPNEPNWETNEREGFQDVTIRAGDRFLSTRVYTKGVDESVVKQKTEMLQKCHDLLAFLQERTNVFLSATRDRDDLILLCVRMFYDEMKAKRFRPNPTVTYLQEGSDDSMKVEFVRQGLRLFLRTNHTIQELDPKEIYFRAVNKPHAAIRPDGTIPPGPSVDESAPFLGNDERLRAYDRHIVISLKESENTTMCLLIHELAHTPPNHVCFRADDHNDDFRFFQWLFLTWAQRSKECFVTRRYYI